MPANPGAPFNNGPVAKVPAGAEKKRTAPITPPSPQEIAAKFSMSWAIINSDAGLKRWFDSFAQRYVNSNGQIDYARFKLELEQQPYWQQHSASWIADAQKELENPQDYAQELQGDVANLRAAASQLGANVNDAQLQELAKNARRFGWNEQQQKRALADFVSAAPTDQGGIDFEGLAGTTQDELTQWASRNGVRLTNDLVSKYTKSVVMGDTSLDEIKSDIRQTYMAGAFPAWADKINAGFDISELAAPYLQNIGAMLEQPDLGLDDELMKRVLQGTDAQGQPRVVPLYEAEKMARSDARWQKTDNAYSTYANVIQNVFKTWGFA